MGAVAVIGLISNIAVVYLLHGSHNLNVRSAFLHVIGDTISSVAVIAVAVWIALTGQVIADIILSGFITVMILISVTCRHSPRNHRHPAPVHPTIRRF